MDLYTLPNVSYFPNKEEKVKRANRFEILGLETDKHEISEEKKCLWFQSSKMIKNYLHLMEKKNLQGHLSEYKDMGLKKLHGKNGFDRPRRELLLSLLS